MHLSDISIRNPVFAVMLTAAMLIFGRLGYREMGLSQFPVVDHPVVTVRTTWESKTDQSDFISCGGHKLDIYTCRL